MRRTLLRLTLLLFVAVLWSVNGCARTVDRRVATYRPGTPSVTQSVHYSSEYTIRYRPLDSAGSKPVAEGGKPVKLVLISGDAVGFRTREDGTLVALLPYGQEKPLVTVPGGLREVYFVTRVRKQTTLARAAEGAGALTVGGGVAATGFLSDAVLNGQAQHATELDEAHGLGFDSVDAYRRWKRDNHDDKHRN